MIKGIAQKDRDFAFHKKHTKKKAANVLFRKNSLASGRRSTLASIREMKKSDEAFRAAQAREGQKRVGITGWLSYTFSRMWRKIKSVFNVASFHGNRQDDVITQS